MSKVALMLGGEGSLHQPEKPGFFTERNLTEPESSSSKRQSSSTSETTISLAGSWNGIRFTGTPRLNPNPEFLYGFELNKDEVYYEVDDQGSLMSRLFLNQSGFIQRLVRSNQSKGWTPVYAAPEDQCDIYSFCGAHAACKTGSSSSVCVCLDGFEPKSPEEWRMSNWSKGCVRMTELNCEKGDEFRNYTGLKLPDTSNSTFNTSMSLQECKEKCLKDCSCTAYTNSNISQEGSGCLLWFGNLTDMIQYDQAGQNFYVRMAAIEKDNGNATVKKRVGIIVGSVIFIAILLVGLIFYIHKRKLKKQDQVRRKFLNWQKLLHIIGGIARGILYLHQDSRMRIIHRDLKASNVLLDNDMNPKISDFGMARIFGENEIGANTNKVVGTYGYMSPEYAVDGLFSVKSDVFSFGVLVLETVSGKKNWRFSHTDHYHNLLGHAWILWKEGRPMELIDDNLGNSGPLTEPDDHSKVAQLVKIVRFILSMYIGFVDHFVGMEDSNAAEILAIHRACQLCASVPEFVEKEIIIASDSKTSVSWVNSHDVIGSLRHVQIIYDICNFLHNLHGTSVVVNPRSSNSCADKLAKSGQIWELTSLSGAYDAFPLFLLLWPSCWGGPEKKTGGSTAISETSSGSAVRDSLRREADSSSHEPGFPPNPFDFSAMSCLLTQRPEY
ncbi:hypothetical protein LWI29_001166 [Acer saccharum]|uniref:non-specific serine/threonine protein kinase n=1 Tax=Acer saccharum TaxID=4024 RepID=A0AA39ST81_ACESA|nr:hypothetical protein LWI29_001166 [Acer saccharum]